MHESFIHMPIAIHSNSKWKCKNNFNSSSECNLQSIVSISISFGYRFYLEHTNVSWTQESMIVGRCLSVAVHSVSPYQLHVLNVCLWPMALCITHINACIFKTPSLSSCTKPNESIDFLMNVNKSFMYVYSFIHVILQLFTRLGSDRSTFPMQYIECLVNDCS